MPLARVIARSPEDASAIRQYLADRGYHVEFADPSALNLEPADLEIDLERCPVEDGLRLASEWAEAAGADVYVASGALPPSERNEPRGEGAPPAEISSYVPTAFDQSEWQQPAEQSEWQQPTEEPASKTELVKETIAQAAGIVADSLSETKEAVSQSFNDMKQRFLSAREQRAAEPTRLERWNRALAERRAARQARKERQREAARLAREQRAQREARAAALARELREHAAREAALRQSAVARSAVPAPATPPRTASKSPLQTVAERRIGPTRRVSQRNDDAAEYWRGAFTGAAAVAILLLVAWATLGTSPAPAPGITSGHVKQDVPFGPVTLTPSAAPAPPATAATSAPVTTPHAVTPPPKPAAVRSHPTRRAAADSGIADDEVVVHHYGTAKPPAASNTTARNSGPKRITDQ